MQSISLVGSWAEDRQSTWLAKVCAVCSGVALLVLSSQIAIPFPGTPVPITGQTFAVSLLGLLWGRNLGLASFVSYIGLASLGLPVLVAGGSLMPGPTLGYLLGMLFSVTLIGELTDRGYTASFFKALTVVYIGSVCVFGFGILGLSYFLPKEALLSAGVLPFLLGDLIKNTAAVSLSRAANKWSRPSA